MQGEVVLSFTIDDGSTACLETMDLGKAALAQPVADPTTH